MVLGAGRLPKKQLMIIRSLPSGLFFWIGLKMKLFKVTSKIFVVIMICSLFTATVYAAKKQDRTKLSKPKNESKKNNSNANNGKQKTLPSIEKKQVKQKNIIKKDINHDMRMLYKQSIQKQKKHSQNANSQKNKTILNSLTKALSKLHTARYNYNPNDTQEQGNMGKVNMLDPYGHDKDSDRMELYGNRGRAIKEPVIEPEPEPQPEPEPEPQPEPEPEPQPEPEPEPLPEPPPEPPF